MLVEVYLADLHVHTALSPCAEAEMTPPAIVTAAAERGVRILGICDHNSAENAIAVAEVGEAAGVAVMVGMEVQTREDVHVLTFFGDPGALFKWQEEVYASLPDIDNDEQRFGEELILDSRGAVRGRLRRLLLSSASMGIDHVGRRVRQLGGLVVPAHVDRPSFSLIRNLGFIPPGLQPDAVEVSPRTGAARARDLFPQIAGLPVIVSSDAHRLDDIRGHTGFLLERPSFDEVRLALASTGGREIVPA
ncbi:MAG: PHP domain-containing protein [Bacillota bacterium]|nr:PHP domain-containing protein [Bacillota bacterium]